MKKLIVLALLVLLIMGCVKERQIKYVKNNPGLSPKMKQNILNSTIAIGMNASEVFATLGHPYRGIRYSKTENGSRSTWMYYYTYIVFKNGYVTGWGSY